MSVIEIEIEIQRAKTILREADQAAAGVARLLPGRLRHVPSWTLTDLKRNCATTTCTLESGRETINEKAHPLALHI